MKRFYKDLKKYREFILYSSKCDLKSEVATSHLNWIWWVLDPLLFMLVYMFIALVVFKKGAQYFPVFVFIGLTMWNFFSRTISSSILVIKKNFNVLSKLYIPKFILIIRTMIVQFIKMCISWGLLVILILLYKVPINLKILLIIPIFISFFIFTFGLSIVLMHIGVFINDLSNIITVVLRLTMYLSGIFYSIENTIVYPYNKLVLYFNPTAFYIDSARNCIIYNSISNLYVLLFWTLIGIIISIIGLKIVYKYENSYAKVTQ